jgi:hypothetical protein
LEGTHIPLQETNPVAQTQTPCWHACPWSQVKLQVPQFWLSLETSMQTPLHCA